MSFTYSGDPSNNEIDKYRFMLGDTDEKRAIFQDQEIQYIVNTYDNENERRHTLFSTAATIFARDIKRSLGPMSEDPTERLKYFKDKAAEYKAKIANGGLVVPVYAYPKVFRKGMQNNPPYPRPRGGNYV